LDEIPPGYVAVGRVLGAWGVGGEVKIVPLAPTSVLAAGRAVAISGREYSIEQSRHSGRFLRLKIVGVDTRDAAQALHGAYVQALERDLEPLPEDEYYRFQLIGLTVRSLDGPDLGYVVDVLSAPENDVYVVDGPFGEVLIPAVDDIVRDIDLTAKAITIEIVPGLLP